MRHAGLSSDVSRPDVRRPLVVAGVVAALVAAAPSVAHADDGGSGPAVDERDLDRRLAFLEHRVGLERAHAVWWWWGWSAFYAGSLSVQSLRAANATDPATQANYWTSATLSGLGLASGFLRPEGNIRGLEPRKSSLTTAEKLARVRDAERVLEANARETHPFGPWHSHLLNLAANGIAFFIVGAGLHDWKQAAIATTLSTSIGEAKIVTAPWEAGFDLEAYRREFGGAAGEAPHAPARRSALTWRVSPGPGGLAWGASF